jgi:hypothetical protein
MQGQSARDARISEFGLGGSKIAQGASKSARDARISEFGLGGIKIGRGGRSKIAQGVIKLGASDARMSEFGLGGSVIKMGGSEIVWGAFKLMGRVIALCICCHLPAMMSL